MIALAFQERVQVNVNQKVTLSLSLRLPVYRYQTHLGQNKRMCQREGRKITRGNFWMFFFACLLACFILGTGRLKSACTRVTFKLLCYIVLLSFDVTFCFPVSILVSCFPSVTTFPSPFNESLLYAAAMTPGHSSA